MHFEIAQKSFLDLILLSRFQFDVFSGILNIVTRNELSKLEKYIDERQCFSNHFSAFLKIARILYQYQQNFQDKI